MTNKPNTKDRLFLPTQGQATLHTQQLIQPATIIQPGAQEINLFSTEYEILSQNAEASRSQLVTPATNAQLVARAAVEFIAGQSVDQIQLWMNVTTQAQLEDYTIRSHLTADLIHRPATPILETDLPANTKNLDKIFHNLQSQFIVAWRLVVLVLTLVLDSQPRENFMDVLNLLAWLWHLGERADNVDQYSRKLGVTHAGNGHGPTQNREKFTNAVQSDKYAPDHYQTRPNTSHDLTRMLGRAPNVQLVNPIATDLIRPGLLNFPTQEEINAQHSIFPYQLQTGSFGIQQQGPFDPFNIQQPFPQAPQAQNCFAGPQQIIIHLGIKSISIDQLLGIIHPNSSNTIVIAITVLATDPVAIPVTRDIVGLTVVPVQHPVQPVQSAQMFQQERGRDMERHQTHYIQMDVSWARSPPSPNVNTQIGERLKRQFPRLKERISKDLVQQHRTAQDQEGYDLVDQKSRHSDPPPAGYAERNVQIRPFIEAHNRGHRFYIHEYQAFWKEYCYKLFKRRPQQSDMRKDTPSSPFMRHDNDKND
ncbi:MAG: hypothetical protein EZS28_008703 [Streblomastix strix]|uniref:Uncharacterized protein n=1 Tax=Streblomastix strix TaxID=222440 RepID=A0A5J4WLM7_9EUKA|nr:MAG: hypothetical protein EZS28_008703 [Streblomastix strix]